MPPTTVREGLGGERLARPGTPSRKPWPRARRQTIIRSIARSCPTITFFTSNSACSRVAADGAGRHRVGNLFDVKLRAIENLYSGRRGHRPRHHHRQRREQRAGRPRHRVRARQPEEDQLPLVPAGVVHRPRRGNHARAPPRAALHAVAPRARREEPDRASASRSATGSRSRSWAPSPTGPTSMHGPRRNGASSPAAATRTAASAWR